MVLMWWLGGRPLGLALPIHVLAMSSLLIMGQSTPGGRRRRDDECLMFKSNDSYVSRVSESYLELGYYDIPSNREFEIMFDVMPSASNHDGPLFAIGTENFAYYEWKTKAVKTQFMVVEFFYSALSMLLKALNHPHMNQLEIHRTHPRTYSINDVDWHQVRAYREIPMDGRPSTWLLELDDLSTIRNVTGVIDVDMFDCKAYLGGRPGYRSSQFRGIIRNLYINGERVRLRGKATYGLTEVWHCSAPEVAGFIDELKSELEPTDYYGRRRRPSARRRNRDEDDPSPEPHT